ncbi:MAG: sterol desaturase family protein [Bacteroidetes bacterium]|nr:sterol desaturase family protein [Bacteroidota bacterium]
MEEWLSGWTWNVESISGLILLMTPFVFILLERYFPYQKGLSIFRKGFWIDFLWYTLIQSFFLKILIFDYIIAPSEVALGIDKTGYISHWPLWAIVLFFVITHDFYIYWFHRFQHSNPWFWRTHEAHHSVENVDWLAGSRSHVVEIIINQTIEFLPIFFLLDVQTAAIVVPIKALIDALWGQFIHANIDVKLGRLGYLINGPELHQWHHADHAEVYHANFSTKLALWDWMFGTIYKPGFKPRRFGVWYRFPRGWAEQHVFSIFRFKVSDWEDQGIGKQINNLRINLLNRMRPWLPKSWFADRLDGHEKYGPKPELYDRIHRTRSNSMA